MEVIYENLLLVMTLVNVGAGVASVTLGLAAIGVLKGESKQDRRQSTKDISKELFLKKDSDRILGHETPTEIRTKQVVRRSPLLTSEGRREYINP